MTTIRISIKHIAISQEKFPMDNLTKPLETEWHTGGAKVWGNNHMLLGEFLSTLRKEQT